MKTICLITTGGTISQVHHPGRAGLVPMLSAEDLLSMVPELELLVNIRLQAFSNVDSAEMTPDDWLQLAELINQTVADPEIAGIIITHGTDTMAVASYFLSLLVSQDKPIVMTGAMNSADHPQADGPKNIVNAVRQILDPRGCQLALTVTMNGCIHNPRFVFKSHSTDIDAFATREGDVIGRVDDTGVYIDELSKPSELLPIPAQLPSVVLLTTFAGDSGQIIRDAVSAGVDGLVIEGFGSGNVNSKTADAIAAALAADIPVVISTRVLEGGTVAIYAHSGGGVTLEKMGAVLSGLLSGPKARLLLMLAMANGIRDTDGIRDVFARFKSSGL